MKAVPLTPPPNGLQWAKNVNIKYKDPSLVPSTNLIHSIIARNRVWKKNKRYNNGIHVQLSFF